MFALSLSLCIFVIGICSAEVPVEDGIAVLSDDNFAEFVKENDFSFIEFYAPWCGHCKSLAPVFIKTAAALKESNANVILAKVDCTQQKQICADVQGYPTIKLFSKSGKTVDYDGERTQEALVAFLSKRTGPASVRITTAEELSTFLEGESAKVIAYVDESMPEFEAWKEVASSAAVELFSFGHVDTSISGEKRRTIELLTKGKEPVSFPIPASLDTEAVLAWISEHGFPLVETLSQETWNRANSHPTSKYLAAIFYTKADGGKVPAFVEEVATQYKGKVIFSVSDQPQILERWEGSGTVLPSVVLLNFNGAQPKLSTWDEATGIEMTAETLKSFIEDSIAGTYKTNIKSEPIPETNDEPVRVLVGRNFESVISDTANKVTFVEFYAPWCGHCKKLAPVLDELGTHFAKNEGVIIAKYDATANSVPKDIQITGFPTMFAFVNGVPNPYPGGHDLESLIAFVDSFVTAPDVDDHVDL